MSSAMSTPRSDDVSAVVILLDVNPYFWGTKTSTGFTFDQFFQHVLVFINCILLLSHLNQVTVIAMGASACTFLYDSAATDATASGQSKRDKQPESRSTTITQKLQEFVKKDEAAETNLRPVENQFSNLSGSLSMALCYIQRILRKPTAPPQPRVS
jgi:transcription initiation factor TFIIH subunit 3